MPLTAIPSSLLAFTWPIHLEYIPGWAALVLFLVLGAVIVFLGIESLSGLGPVRKWVAIGLRLTVLLLFILIVGGIRWQRVHKSLEVMALVDVSGSMRYYTSYPGYPATPLRGVEDQWISSLGKEQDKQSDDKLGVISFKQNALIDLMPTKEPKLDTHAIPDPGTGTDAGSAIQLALATLSKDAMHRLVLFWDGNDTTGNLDAALEAAAAQHVQIDVVPLHYDVKNAAMIDRFVAPTWKRENEPFTLSIILTSTADHPVKGKLSVTHETTSGKTPLDMDLSTPQIDPYRQVTLPPASVNHGKWVEYVKVPALKEGGVHQFHAAFAPDEAGATATVEVNNTADAFTFVHGESKVLYVDNARDQDGNLGPGEELARALRAEQIQIDSVTVDGIPKDAVTLQNYDAVIFANVPRSAMTEEQDTMFQSYVHDMGGGMVMIGGDQAFGAGGWQGSAIEKILPVDMDIPAQRQIGKGALVLVMHSCEFPNGNYWGVQCALQAISTLSAHDQVGIITYGWGTGGSQWDLPLQEKGDGSAANAAAKKMQPGDMPDFDDTLRTALNGKGGSPGLVQSDAQFKHVIIISDGDPTPPQQALMDAYIAHKISVSTVSVYPHSGEKSGVPAAMFDMAQQMKGRWYGPINGNFNQLPKIFIKEATVVRRTLLHLDAKGIPLQLMDPSDEFINGLTGFQFPSVYGMVLTARKQDPKVVMPLTAGQMHDPVLAHWQTGLGRAVVFTSDATAIWAADWFGSGLYPKFWAQIVRGVRRPPMPANFEAQTAIIGDKGKITVEAIGKDGQYLNFENMEATVLRPDMTTARILLNATGPGTYEGTFDAKTAGNYVAAVQYNGKEGSGVFPTGAAMNSEPEYRELKSNDRLLHEIAARTNGHIIEPFDANGADIFRREGLTVTSSPLPVWDVLLPFLLALIILDVATRRIAWDWASLQRMGFTAATRVREFTSVRRVESRSSVDALKRVRDEVAETRFKPAETSGAAPATSGAPRPDPKAKFTAPKGVEGDITQVVGGATDKPVPPPPKKIEPKGAGAPKPGEHTGNLLEAKRRAQQQIKKKEEGE
jgi:uncharacterized membrane protein